MTQIDRNWLFNLSYHFDNHRRIMGKDKQMFVVFTHEEMEKLADDIRKMAAGDEQRVTDKVLGKKR